MNPRALGSSILLTAVVAVAVLLIGAFAHFDTTSGQDTNAAGMTPAPAVSTTATPSPAAVAPAPAPVPPALPADLSPGLADIIRLAQSHVADDTIIAFAQNSGIAYNPTADELLYLNDLGLSEKVINALFKKPGAAIVAAAPTNAAPSPMLAASDNATSPPPDSLMQPPPADAAMVDPVPVADPQENYFYTDLAPYGSWVQVVGIGWCWQPMVSTLDSSWQPYNTRGHWLYTDEGWYWASDYSWGWAPFHYGRWSHDDNFGWVWSPGSVWAPAWVAWRNGDTFAGWAPLPPAALFRPGIGLYVGTGVAGVGESFGLRATAFTFVAYEHFLSPRVSSFAALPAQSANFFTKSSPANNYTVKGHKLINSGISADRIAAVTKTPVRTFALHEALSPETSGARVRGEGLGIAVFRPEPAALPRTSSPAAQPVLINRDVRQQAGFAAPPPQTPAEVLPARPSVSGFAPGNFQPAPRRIIPSGDVSMPANPSAPALENRASRPNPSSAEVDPRSYAPRGLPAGENRPEPARTEPVNSEPPRPEPPRREPPNEPPQQAQNNFRPSEPPPSPPAPAPAESSKSSKEK